jgi:hypothetical protein
MEKTTITKRELYDAIKEAFTSGTCKYEAETIIAFCDKEIASLDSKAAKAKERAAAKKAEADVLLGQVQDALTDEYQTIADITVKVSAVNSDATTSKVTNRLSKLVEAEIATKTQITIPATETTKTRKVQGYKLAD